MNESPSAKNLNGVAFQRTILRQALLGEIPTSSPSYVRSFSDAFIANVETNGSCYLKLNHPGHAELITLEMANREIAFKAMQEIEADPKSLGKYFPSLDPSESFLAIAADIAPEDAGEVNPRKITKFGFWNYDSLSIQEVGFEALKTIDLISPDLDQLSLGNLLSEVFEYDETLPKTMQEALIIRRFFEHPSTTVGMFGNLKFILKTLTDRMTVFGQEIDEEVFISLSGSAGMGYGQVDAYLSKGTLVPEDFYSPTTYSQQIVSPESYLQFHLSKLPEFGHRSYPSLSTSQYLSRKGLRFYKFLCGLENKVAETTFKAAALSISDKWDQASKRNSRYQLLTNLLLFGGSDDVIRDRSGRTVSVSDNPDYFEVVRSELENATKGQIGALKEWLTSIEGFNAHVDIYRAILSLELGVETTWREHAVRYLSNSSDIKVLKAIAGQVVKTPQLFAECSPSNWPIIMRILPLESLDQVLSQLEYKRFTFPPYLAMRATLVANWLDSLTSEEFTENEIKISQKVLRGWKYYVPEKPKYKNVVVRLAKQSQLQPGDQWVDLVDFDSNQFNFQSYLDLLGLNDESDGLLMVIDEVPKEIIEAASIGLTWALRSGLYGDDTESQKNAFKRIFNFKSPIFISLLARGMVIDSFQYNYDNGVFSNYLTEYVAPENHETLKSEFLLSCLAYLQNNSESNPLAEKDALLKYFLLALKTDIGKKIAATHRKEIEECLHSSKILTAFLWSNLEVFADGVPDILVNSELLRKDLMSQVTPSFIKQITETQTDLLVTLLTNELNSTVDDAILKSLVLAPNERLNRLGVNVASKTGKVGGIWLEMIESDIPITSKAGLTYLESQKDSGNFQELLLQALDSNNSFARKSALELLERHSSPKLLASVVSQLTENRNPDTWGTITENIGLISEVRDLQRFTRRLFLSKRKSRIHKENVKRKLSNLVKDLDDVLEKDLILKLSLGSNKKDREWALNLLAHEKIAIGDVIIEKTWKVERDV